MKAIRIRPYEHVGNLIPHLKADGTTEHGIMLDLEPNESYATFDYKSGEWTTFSGHRGFVLMVHPEESLTYDKIPEGFENHVLELWRCGSMVGVILMPE